MLEKLNVNKQNSGVIVAFNGKDQIQIADIDFLGGNSLPLIKGYRDPYTLPETVKCFKGEIIDDDFTVTVSCQNIPEGNETAIDYLCQLKTDSAEVQCDTFEVMNQVNDRIVTFIEFE